VISKALIAKPKSKIRMSSVEYWPVVTRPKPYAVAATESVKAIDAMRFHTANWLSFILAVPEMMAGVKKTARRPHLA